MRYTVAVPNESVNIRPYEERDKERVEAFIAAFQDQVASADEHRIQRHSHEDFDGPKHLEFLQKHVKKNHGTMFVAESDGAIVGYIVSFIFETEPNGPHHPTKSGHIEEVVVAESLRGKGIGATLIAAMETWLAEQGCVHARLECFVNNRRAHALYEKLGYKDRYVNMIKSLS